MRLLDLFCGAGGAAMGYSRAGFTDIVGVDNQPQKNYPFEFIQADALEYLAEAGHEFDVIHASPPCQAYSIMRNLPWLKHKEYPALIAPVRDLLDDLDKPWVIENVMGARKGSRMLSKYNLENHGLDADYLCGAMFELPFYRHRLFAANWTWTPPEHATHRVVIGSQKVNRPRRGETFIFDNPVNSDWRKYHDGVGNGAQKNGVAVGHAKGWRLAAEAMGIDWMKREELTQAIPPAYTEYIGKFILGEN